MSTLENNDVIDADIIDIECADESTDKQIRGRAKYWSPSQVADILDIPVSTVRYYAIQFADLLDYPVVNKQKKFLDSDIEKLKFILELKNDGMSLQQIKEYCSEVSFTENGIQVKESNP
ncbi:MAG: MerR family transcriptional regulator, partial [Peptostreptococcaceae bacterium]